MTVTICLQFQRNMEVFCSTIHFVNFTVVCSGSPETLYESVHSQIFSLPDNTTLYPAHDYKGRTTSTVVEEKKFNLRLTKSKEEFVNIMKNLGLKYPKLIDLAVPANLKCGIED